MGNLKKKEIMTCVTKYFAYVFFLKIGRYQND